MKCIKPFIIIYELAVQDQFLKRNRGIEVPRFPKKLPMLPDDRLHWSVLAPTARSVQDSNGIKGAFGRFYAYGLLNAYDLLTHAAYIFKELFS